MYRLFLRLKITTINNNGSKGLILRVCLGCLTSTINSCICVYPMTYAMCTLQMGWNWPIEKNGIILQKPIQNLKKKKWRIFQCNHSKVISYCSNTTYWKNSHNFKNSSLNHSPDGFNCCVCPSLPIKQLIHERSVINSALISGFEISNRKNWNCSILRHYRRNVYHIQYMPSRYLYDLIWFMYVCLVFLCYNLYLNHSSLTSQKLHVEW